MRSSLIALALALALRLPASAGAEGRVELREKSKLAGSTLTLRFHAPAGELTAIASGFRQEAAFYFAVSASAGTEGALAYALLAVPLDAKPGRHRVRVRWTEAGIPRSWSASLRVRGRPRSDRVVRLPKKARKAVEALKGEKPLIQGAFRNAEGPPSWRGSFRWPCGGRLSEPFGVSRRYLPLGVVWRHKGVDLAAPEGTPFCAPNDGVVSLAREGLRGHGGVVVLSHGYGLASGGFHLWKVMVKEGQRVAKGDVLGLVGSEGLSTGAHLHFQMSLRGEPVEPQAWMDSPAPPGLK